MTYATRAICRLRCTPLLCRRSLAARLRHRCRCFRVLQLQPLAANDCRRDARRSGSRRSWSAPSAAEVYEPQLSAISQIAALSPGSIAHTLNGRDGDLAEGGVVALLAAGKPPDMPPSQLTSAPAPAPAPAPDGPALAAAVPLSCSPGTATVSTVREMVTLRFLES